MMSTKRQNEGYVLLAGDIGGTKVSLALYSPARGARYPEHQATFAVEDHASLASLLDEYLPKTGARLHAASFGAAGPIVGRKVELTNHDWLIDAAELEGRFGLTRVWLMNDLKAAANAIPHLRKEELHTLSAGKPDPEGNIAVIAPGTGLGEGFIARDGEGYSVHAGEGGHSDFAPRGELQRDLLAYLSTSLNQVSVEDVCGGVGIPNIYRFLRDSGRAEEPDWLAQALSQAEDPNPVIFGAALGDDPPQICRMVLEVFVKMLGHEAANLAIKIGATGGLYLGGGIPPRILEALVSGILLDAFWDKRLYGEYMQRIPVHVILNRDAGLLGAAEYGLSRIDL